MKSPDPTRHTPFYKYKANALYCENVPFTTIAERVGTPTYVYSRAAVEAAYRRFARAFAGVPHTIAYAVKANSNLSILRLLARLGSGFDIVSGGELYRLLRAGVPGRRIVFSGPGKSREEIREALRAGILLFNVESEGECEVLAEEASRHRRPAIAAIRVNPNVPVGGHPHVATGEHQHKFGMTWKDARRLYLDRSRARWIAWRGISAHIGSQVLHLAPFGHAVLRLANFTRELQRNGLDIRYFDFGGGLAVRYSNETPPPLASYAQLILRAIKPLQCHLLLEPGRALVAGSGVLLARVLGVKHSSRKRFVIVDAAMNDFLRPALYGAVHPITPVVRSHTTASSSPADIVGPVCESGDCFLRDWPLPQVEPGDLLALWGAGAYGFVQASNYNSRPRPAEVLVDHQRFRVIRRREKQADLVRGE